MRVRITKRDVAVAVVAAGVTLGLVVYAQEKPAAILKSTVFDWNSWPVRNTDVGHRGREGDRPPKAARRGRGRGHSHHNQG